APLAHKIKLPARVIRAKLDLLALAYGEYFNKYRTPNLTLSKYATVDYGRGGTVHYSRSNYQRRHGFYTRWKNGGVVFDSRREIVLENFKGNVVARAPAIDAISGVVWFRDWPGARTFIPNPAHV